MLCSVVDNLFAASLHLPGCFLHFLLTHVKQKKKRKEKRVLQCFQICMFDSFHCRITGNNLICTSSPAQICMGVSAPINGMLMQPVKHILQMST
jgi:hypothetical protein